MRGTNQRVRSTELADRAGEQIELRGWLHNLRQLSNVTFLILRDGAGTAQIVVEDAALARRLASLPHESVLAVRGLATSRAEAPNGVEVVQPDVTVLSVAEEPPVAINRKVINAQLPTLLDYAPVTLRHPRRRAAFLLTAAALTGFRDCLRGLGFVEVQTPKIVPSATEGGANVFRVQYFDRNAYLAQSPQFYKQIMVGVFERVFTVGPVFRAEPHDTPRHINEYVSLDIEMGFIRDHTDVMTVLRQTIAAMFERMTTDAGDAVRLLELVIPPVPEHIPVVHFQEALEMISADTHEDRTREPDLAPNDESWLGEWARRKHNSEFVFVVGFPLLKRPFYTHPDPTRPGFSNSFDLLFRGLELVTGGQRLHRYADYLESLKTRGIAPEPFESYLQAFRYGMPPHGGFAIGLERLIARLVGAQNIRETTLFPRDINRISP